MPPDSNSDNSPQSRKSQAGWRALGCQVGEIWEPTCGACGMEGAAAVDCGGGLGCGPPAPDRALAPVEWGALARRFVYFGNWSPNMGKPLLDCSFVASSWMTSQCSARTPFSILTSRPQ